MKLSIIPSALIGMVALAAGYAIAMSGIPTARPYAGIDGLDEKTEQTPAVIQIGDPQIYARETLINDRRREAAYLNDLIAESEDVDYVPELQRNLHSFSALTLGVEARTDLGLKSRALNGDGEGQPGDSDGQPQQSHSNDPISLRASPREEFLTRQAYRQELRSALAAELLDDSHDLGENAIYRLQFNATLLPGKSKNKFGVARFTIYPPELRKPEYERLYRVWLSHITYRLNETVGSKAVSDLNHALFGAASGLFELMHLRVPRHKNQSEHAHPDNRPELATSPAAGHDRIQDCARVGQSMQGDAHCEVIRIAVFPGLLLPEDRGSAGVFLNEESRRRADIAPGGLLSARTGLVAEYNGRRKLHRRLASYFEKLSVELSALEERRLESGIAVENARAVVKNAEKVLSATIEELNEEGGGRGTRGKSQLIFNSAQAAMSRSKRDLGAAINVENLAEVDFDKAKSRLERAREDLNGSLEAVLAAKDNLEDFDRLFRFDEDCKLESKDDVLPEVIGGGSVSFAYDYARQVLRYSGFVSASLRGLLGRSLFELVDSSALEELAYEMSLAPHVARRVMNEMRDVVAREHHYCLDYESTSDRWRIANSRKLGLGLELFMAALESERPANHGFAYAYSAGPKSLVQRLSTTARAVNSMEMAFALAALHKGIGLDGGLNLLERTQGKVDALQQLPLVVGFSERNSLASEADDKEDELLSDSDEAWPAPQFGWIFGPKVVLNPVNDEVKLEQSVASYSVTADVSVPGWWPWVSLSLDSAWIRNWHDGELLLTNPKSTLREKTMRVQLPLNRADLDGLTELLAKKTVGGAVPVTKISTIQPDRVSVRCPNLKESIVPASAEQGEEEKQEADTSCVVTFLVFGTNLWRGPEAYLNGRPHSSIRVLPDMAGIAAAFDIEGLPRNIDNYCGVDLTVWTRHGTASSTVTIADPAIDPMSIGPMSCRRARATSVNLSSESP